MLGGKHLLNSFPPNLAEVLQTKMLARVLKPCKGSSLGARRVCSWVLTAWSSSQLLHFPCPGPAGGTSARLRDQKMKLYSSIPHPDQSSPALYLPQGRTASAPGSAFILKICSLRSSLNERGMSFPEDSSDDEDMDKQAFPAVFLWLFSKVWHKNRETP